MRVDTPHALILSALLALVIVGCNRGSSTDTGTGSGPDSGVVSGAPENISVSLAPGTVVLHWPAVDGAGRYRIYWSNRAGVTDADRWEEVSAKQQRFEHGNLIAGSDYHYRIAAIGREAGPLSGELRVTVPAPSASVASDRAP